jgi:[acyl-carrier-protein] S-malonyltransferase
MAVIGLSVEEVETLLNNFEGISIANINSSKQVVVGGQKKNLEEFNSFLKTKKIKGIMLNVSGPFHTPFMKEASLLLEQEIKKVSFKDPEIPIYLNYSGKRTTDREEIKKGLIQQIYSPVRWVSIIKNITEDAGDIIFVEVGPKTVLKRLIEGIIPEAKVLNVENFSSLEITLKELT